MPVLRDVLKSGAWFSFHFVDVTFSGKTFPQAAMAVNATDRFSGQKLLLQVDTACSENLLYDGAALPDGTSAPFARTLDFEGGFSTELVFSSNAQHIPAARSEDAPHSDGTLGLAVFGRHGFAIDYPARRLHVLDEAQLDALSARFNEHFAPCVPRAGVLFALPVIIAGQEVPTYLDTGSGAFQLILDRAIWSRLTGLPIDAPAVEHFQVPAWGKALDVAGVPVKCEVRLPGGHRLPLTMAHTLSAAPMSFANLGNAPFLDAIVVVNFRDRLFGYFPKADPAC